MEKLRLTKAEKAVLLELAGHPITKAEPRDNQYVCALCTLKRKELVDCSILKTAVMHAELTPYGRSYILNNPRLTGPVPWDRIISLATLIAAILALFVGCIRLMAATLH